jgi:8-oxo-dGTP diphosphatase
MQNQSSSEQESTQPIGVCALIFNHEGKLLLGKRKNSYCSGYYGVPGGRVEINERLEAALAREIKEETDLLLQNPIFIGVVRENQGSYDFIHFVFAFSNVTQTPVLCEPEKSEKWEWFDPENLPDPVVPGHEAGIHLYKNNRFIEDLTLSELTRRRISPPPGV